MLTTTVLGAVLVLGLSTAMARADWVVIQNPDGSTTQTLTYGVMGKKNQRTQMTQTFQTWEDTGLMTDGSTQWSKEYTTTTSIQNKNGKTIGGAKSVTTTTSEVGAVTASGVDPDGNTVE